MDGGVEAGFCVGMGAAMGAVVDEDGGVAA